MRKLATIRTILDVREIPGADAIEVATVDGWDVVVKKGEFKVGDRGVYFEIDSFLPMKPQFEFLRKNCFKMMNGKEGFRLKTIRLRGQISQGLLLKPEDFEGVKNMLPGSDVTDLIGVLKYELQLPNGRGSQNNPQKVRLHNFPSDIRKTNEERIQNMSGMYEKLKDMKFYVSEKLDGSSMTVTYMPQKGFVNTLVQRVRKFFGKKYKKEGLIVCSRNLSIEKDTKNNFWKAALKYDLESKMKELFEKDRYKGRRLALQGELVGPGIQGNKYDLREVDYYVFNVYDIDKQQYCTKTEMEHIVVIMLALKRVPVIAKQFSFPGKEKALEISEGKSALNLNTEREGLVWVSDNPRVSFKTISNKFLLKDK